LAIFDSLGIICHGPSMSTTPTRNIALTRELEGYIKAQVASGHYANASEVVRAGLRLLIERDHKALRSRKTLSAGPADA
jgi:putative addiction module CopG family antidote